MNARNLIYALVLGFIALPPLAQAMDPIDHQPIADLAAALKNAGQVRIAQGIADVLSRDTETGTAFVAKVPLMLTTDSKTGAWTISVLHDKLVGSTLLIGDNLQRPAPDEIPALATFDRSTAQQAINGIKGFDVTYYPDEIKRLGHLGFVRMYTGKVALTTEPHFKSRLRDCFADIVVIPKTGEFMVLVIDQYGACIMLAFGGTFSEKS